MKLIEKFKELSLPVKASIAYLVVNIILKGWAFFTTPIFTRLLTPEQYGVVATYYSYYELIFIVATFCLQGGIFNNGMVDYPQKRGEFSLSMLSLSNVITLLTVPVVVIIYYLWGERLGLHWAYFVLMFATYLIQPAFGFWAARQRYEYKYKSFSVVSVISVVIASIIAIVAVYLAGEEYKAFARLYGYEGTLLLFYLVFYFFVLREGRYKTNRNYWKPALMFNAVLIPHYFSTYVLSSSDRIMIANMVGNKEAGIYSLGYSIGLVLMALWMAINNSLIPYTYENCKKGDYKSISKATSAIVILYGLSCFCLILVAPEFLAILAPSTYGEALSVIPPIVGGMFFLALYNVFSNIVFYHKKPKYVTVGSLSSAVINILLNILLIPIIGYQAAAYTTLFCYLIQASIDYFAMKHIVGENVYPMKVFCIISIAIIIISFTADLLYERTIARYIIILLIAILACLNRNKIMKILAVRSH